MNKIGIIACSNGMGHISRSIKLGIYLSRYYTITIITNRKKFYKLNNYKKLKIIDTKNYLNVNFKKNNYNLNWHRYVKKKIKNFKIDFLISDNLPEVVHINKKFLIIANFFWHKLFKIKNSKINSTLKKIKNKRLYIAKNVLLKEKNENFNYIGFLGTTFKSKKKNTILISLGSDFKSDKEIEKELDSFIFNNKKFKIFLDKSCYKKKYRKFNTFIADHSDEMFKKIKLAIIKPGFGIIQKCFEFNIYPISYSKYLNKEYKTNAKKLEKYKIGKRLDTFSDCISLVQAKKNFYLNYKKNLSMGEKKIYKIIKNINSSF